MKPCLVEYMYFKWLVKVIKGQRLAKGIFCFQTTKDTLEAQKGTVPLGQEELLTPL